MTLHIGILQTDHVLDELQATHGDYPSMFRVMFDEAASDVTYTNYDVVAGGMPANVVCDAYVITGSRHSVYDPLPWIGSLVKFISQALDAGRKVVGVCFGHQLMAHYFGGRVAPAASGWAVGVHRSQWIGSSRGWLDRPQGQSDQAPSLALLSSHKDQVQELPDDAVLYLTNQSCPIAGFTIGDQVITVQGHPEFRKNYARDLLNLRREMLGDSLVSAGLKSLQVATDEVSMARCFVNFLRASKL